MIKNLSLTFSIFKQQKQPMKWKKIFIAEVLAELSTLDNTERETVRDAIVKARINQSKFRSDLLRSDRNKCLFTNVTEKKLLIAGHIKPWRESTNIERTDINNGILLTPTFDKLFDRFLISFDGNGALLYSPNIKKEVWNELFPTFEKIKK
jgi:predicted restriction endonuclease